MNFERFIAKHISSSKSDNYAKPVVIVSFISIALGLALMIISIAVVVGFKNSISSKIIGFTSHLQIVPFDNNESLEERPITVEPEFIENLYEIPNISHIQFSAKKAGVVKTDEQMQGIIFKGIDENFDRTFLKSQLVAGSFPDLQGVKSDNILISKTLSNQLNVNVGDDLRTWFITGNNSAARGRKFKIAGLFDTSLEEFDNVFIIGDIRQVQKLNDWDHDQVGSIEISVKDPQDLQDFAFDLYGSIPYNLRVVTVQEEYPQIFNWLDLLDMNVVVILVLLVLVAAITMISTLLILILERTSMVGILKSLGANNRSIQKIFLFKAGVIILKGMFWGNLLGLGFLFIQFYFKVVTLSPENYYVNYVPVEINWLYLLLLNLGAFIVSGLMLIAPLFYVSRIVPALALRYE